MSVSTSVRIGVALLATLAVTRLVSADDWTSARPDGHAPIGVMGDHIHHHGEWMFSYRLMLMEMEGSRVGTDDIADADVVSPSGANFRVTPTEMPMTMHMLGAMYAPSDRITLSLTVPVLDLEMDHLTRPGGSFTTGSSGVGDVGVTALWSLVERGPHRVHLNAGFSLPTGSIDERDVTPASAPNASQLPYPMQLGSGTFDLKPGLTYLGEANRWSWGGQASATVRLGDNDRDYRLGHGFVATGWASRRLWSWLSVSARLEGSTWGDIDGADPELAGAVASRMVPTVLPDLRGGSRVDAGFGANLWVPRGGLKGLRLAVEYLVPLHEDLHGPQLGVDSRLVLGIQQAF